MYNQQAAVALSWQDIHTSKMTYKPSKLGQIDLVFGLRSELISRQGGSKGGQGAVAPSKNSAPPPVAPNEVYDKALFTTC